MVKSISGTGQLPASLASAICALLLAALPVARAQDQHAHGDSGSRLRLSAQAIALLTRQAPALASRSLTEAYVTQPALMGHFTVGVVRLSGMISLEGLTLLRGELNPGAVGEGYIDRRHPHTYLHELTATIAHRVGRVKASFTTGKGFAPFGTDDPMSRPFVKYPINHHLAQVLERIVAIAAVSAGPLTVEAGAFNGDEPESPRDAPNASRMWDSRSARVTVRPVRSIEAQVSYARVRSPEHPMGGGPDDVKWSASARYASLDDTYALLELARTRQQDGSSSGFSFRSFLIEGKTGIGRFALAARAEVTERPDEDRLTDPFRTPLSDHDFSILGRSRWTILTARVALPVAATTASGIIPFIEVARHHVTETLVPSGFSPRQFYGSDRIWTTSFGAKLMFGQTHQRMGRYGAAER